MGRLTYRLASPDDAALIERLFRESFVETFGHLYAPEDLQAFLAGASVAAWREELADPAMRVRIAEDEGVAAGFARIGSGSLPVEKPPGAVELRQLYVLRPWHGTGVGRALMDWALGQARAQGAEQMFLSVFVDNHRARRFYARYGFEQVGTYDFMVGSHADLDLIMRLRL